MGLNMDSFILFAVLCVFLWMLKEPIIKLVKGINNFYESYFGEDEEEDIRVNSNYYGLSKRKGNNWSEAQ